MRQHAFRDLWMAGCGFHVGNAMLNMAASWLMLEITQSSFLAALVQTASFLPMFMFSLPAGVLADTIDRGKLMMTVQGVYGACALVLTLLAVSGTIGAASLLVFTFVLGACTTLQGPAWNLSMNERLAPGDFAKGINLQSMAYNGARAIGPALAGVVLAAVSASAVFVFAVMSAIVMSLITRRWRPAPPAAGRLPAERLWGGMLSALRFARHSPAITAQLVRTVAFAGVGSAVWALLPVIAQQRLGLGAAGYGLLAACLGGGAVCAGLVVVGLRARIGLEALAIGCCCVFACTTAVAAWSTHHLTVYAFLVAGGGSWMAILSTFNSATQISSPPWVRARAASMHLLCSLGSFALFSALWGALASLLGVSIALSISAACMLASIALARRFPLRINSGGDVTLAEPQHEFIVEQEPELESGPIAVEVIYRIRPEDAPQFLKALQQLAEPRKRDGATFWRIYRDIHDPARYVERFIVTSWGDYLRHRARATVSAQELEAQARQFQIEAQPVEMRHYLAEQTA